MNGEKATPTSLLTKQASSSDDDIAMYKARTAKMLRDANIMTQRYKAEAQRNAEADAAAAAEAEALKREADEALAALAAARSEAEAATEEAAAATRESEELRKGLLRATGDLETSAARAAAAEQTARTLRRGNEDLQLQLVTAIEERDAAAAAAAAEVEAAATCTGGAAGNSVIKSLLHGDANSNGNSIAALSPNRRSLSSVATPGKVPLAATQPDDVLGTNCVVSEEDELESKETYTAGLEQRISDTSVPSNLATNSSKTDRVFVTALQTELAEMTLRLGDARESVSVV